MRRRIDLFILLSILFLGVSTKAEDPNVSRTAGDDLTNRYRYRVEETLRELRSLQPDCPSCGLFTAGDSKSSMTPECRRTYQNIFKIKDSAEKETKADQVIDISLAFGYMDFEGATEDRYISYAFETELRASCRAGAFACGFTQNPDDSESFYKQIRILGPDGRPRTRTVSVHVRSSSVSESEELNRGELSEEQTKKSASTEAYFLSALKNSDVAFYIGHARDGGGPDFSPPILNKKQKPDYNWYHKHQPGVLAMENALQGATHPAKVVGIFACYAEDHFSAWLKELLPSSGVILSGQQEFEASLAQATASLDSILGLRCQEQFQKSVDLLTDVNHVVITPVHLERVFQNR